MNTLPIFILFLLLLLICGSCHSSKEILIPKEVFNINLSCDNDCNNSNAIVIRIYQLKNVEKFQNASFESLIRNPEETLADDLIPNSKYEKTLIPGESIQLKDIEIKDSTAYLGVIGDFNSPAKDGWLKVVPMKKAGNIEIMVHENSLSIK